MIQGVQLIAEVKTKSPFGFESKKSWDELFEVAHQYGDIISVHTDPRWGGSFDLVRKARSRTHKPILAKGIHALESDVRSAIDAGADWVLVVGRIPQFFQEKCMIEPHTLAELEAIPSDFRVVWNSRDLDTGGKKNETFVMARALWGGWMCQASNIKSMHDVESGADAILVGEYLEEFIKSSI